MKKLLAIKEGIIVTVAGAEKIIQNGSVLVDGSKIVAVGAGLEIPSEAQVIDASGKWVTPGFIDVHTHISTLNEPQTMPVTPGALDLNEMSNPITPHIRGIDALNPHDVAIENARKAGFTTCYTGPGSANVIGGTGISFKTKKGNTVFDIAILGSEHMKMALGENPKRVYGSDKKMPMTRMGVAAILRETLYNAQVYADQLEKAKSDPDKKPKPDFKLESLLPVIRGEMKCRVHAHRADDIVTAVRICKEFNLKFSVEHCTEGYKILDYLKENGIDCVVGPLTMSLSKMEIWGCKLETPGLMEKAGINFCLTEDTASDIKYLPTHVGYCVARGLSEKRAFEAVTLRAAKLLGLEECVGSLEVGKDADISIFSGHPFSNLSLCEKTIIDGSVYDNLR
ncbi:MAG: amidohydrolase [Synergistaceae bacterium]|nr:amidohydrolase [Synergistaceae bacterium]